LPFYAAAKVESQQKAAKKRHYKRLDVATPQTGHTKKQKQLWTPLQSSYKQTKMF